MARMLEGIPLNERGVANLAIALAMVPEDKHPGFAATLAQTMREAAVANTEGFECCVCRAFVPPHCGTCCPQCGTW